MTIAPSRAHETGTDTPTGVAKRSATEGRARTPDILRTRRRPQWIVAGVLCLALGALGAIWLFGQLGSTQTVVQVTRPVSRGEVITASDIRVVTIGTAPGVSLVRGDDTATVVGQTARIDLAAGALLPAESVGPPVAPAGMSQVGIRLSPGRIPAADLPPQTRLMLVPVPVQAQPAPEGRPIPATLATRPQQGDDGTVTITVLVASTDAHTVAQWAAGDHIGVVREF